MAKIIDITDRLNFDESPALSIKGEEIKVNSDAPTVLKIMGLMSEGDPGVQEVLGAYELMFSKEARKKIEAMRLSFADLVTVIKAGISLIVGEDKKKEE